VTFFHKGLQQAFNLHLLGLFGFRTLNTGDPVCCISSRARKRPTYVLFVKCSRISGGICEKLSLALSAPDVLLNASLWISADSVQSGSILRPRLPLPLSINDQPKQRHICHAVIVCIDGQLYYIDL
jgi:hypothetical protein